MTDVLVNLDTMARKLGVSLPTMRKLARLEGFPIVQAGGLGVPWQLDPAAVIGFVQSRREEEEAGRATREDLLSQIVLPDEVPAAPGYVTPSERLKVAQAQRVEMQVLREAGHLVLKTDMRPHLTSVWTAFQQAMLAMPGAIARRHNLPAAVTSDMRRYVEGQLRNAHRTLGDLLPASAAPPESDAPPA